MAQNEVVYRSISCVDLQSEFLSLFKLSVGTCLLKSTLSMWLEPIFQKRTNSFLSKSRQFVSFTREPMFLMIVKEMNSFFSLQLQWFGTVLCI